MGIVIGKNQDFIVAPALTEKMTGLLKSMLGNWLNSQSRLQRDWSNFKTISTGRGVPFRVWLRHSAYLEELKREKRRH